MGLPTHAVSHSTRYQVQEGETLSEIAERHLAPGQHVYFGKDGGLLSQLLRLNPTIQDPNRVIAGQKIRIPATNLFENRASANTAAKASQKTSLVFDQPFDTVDRRKNRSVASQGVGADAVCAGSAEPEKSLARREPPENGLHEGYEIFSIQPDYFSTNLNARQVDNQAGANLVSDSNAGATLSYSQVWSESLTTDFHFGIRKLSIKKLGSATTTTLEGQDSILKDFGASATFKMNDGLLWGGGLSFVERPFLRGASSTSVAIDPLSVPSFETFARYALYSKAPFALGLSLGLGIDAPMRASENAFKTRWNPNLHSAVFIRRDVGARIETEAGLAFNWARENTTLIEQSQRDMGLYLTLRMPFGQGKTGKDKSR